LHTYTKQQAAAPLLMISAVSNLCFFAWMSVWNHFMWRLFADIRFIDIVYVCIIF